MPTIEQLLHRRTDLSTFVVHFTSGTNAGAEENLVSILSSNTIEARSVYGMGSEAATRDARIAETQRVVCFSETPLEHAWMMVEDIEGRGHRLSPYGVAFTKVWARSSGINPVWYLDISQRGRDWLTQPVNALIGDAVRAILAGSMDVHDAEILKLTPFIEQMGPTLAARKEFWWEREWRKAGTLQFAFDQVVVVFAPEAAHDRVSGQVLSQRARNGMTARPMRPILDPTWGLERMLTRLAGIADEAAGPLP
jgi:hypothetical protein